MVLSFILLLFSLLLLIKSADFAIRYSIRLAEGLRLSKYLVGFIIVAIISILPEMFVAVTSALEGVPSFGLGALFGSNVADLTLVFTLIIFIAGRNLKVESKIIKNRFLYVGALFFPIILGLNGYYSRLEGVILICVGFLFYCFVIGNSSVKGKKQSGKFNVRDVLYLLLSMGGLLLGSYLTVRYGESFAIDLKINPIFIGMFIVGLGTTLPELLFSIKAARQKHDGLALGDILGTVIADATIVVGLLAVISPFEFSPRIIYVTGLFMLSSAVLLLYFLKSGKVLTKKEAILLFLFYVLFVFAELIINQ